MSYMNCLLSSSSKEELRCTPGGRVRSKLLRTISPMPGATHYEPGASYYYISTSSGKHDGIEQKSHGLCHSQNLRLRVDVEENAPTQASSPTESTVYIEHPRAQPYNRAVRPSSIEPTSSESAEERRAQDVPFRRPASITPEKMQQVIEWAQQGVEGDFRFGNEVPEHTSGIDLNRPDGGAEAYYVVNEDAALYASKTSGTRFLMPLLLSIVLLFR
ncbi:unnamed protein product, partial [Mesorhabditis spiculigera]